MIEGSQRILHDIVIPNEFPPDPNSTYRSGYHWLYRYERDLMRRLDPWLRSYRFELIGENGLLAEALSNAFYHGHRKDPDLPIEVNIFEGAKGVVVQIRDSGKGFDVKDTHNHYLMGKNYFHAAGNGFRIMVDSKRYGIFFDAFGTTFHLLYLVDQSALTRIRNSNQ